MHNKEESVEKSGHSPKLKAFLTGAILAASAVVGGFALVIWNRKALSGLRQHPEPEKEPPSQADSHEE
jgi:hypothetical protein